MKNLAFPSLKGWQSEWGQPNVPSRRLGSKRGREQSIKHVHICPGLIFKSIRKDKNALLIFHYLQTRNTWTYVLIVKCPARETNHFAHILLSLMRWCREKDWSNSQTGQPPAWAPGTQSRHLNIFSLKPSQFLVQLLAANLGVSKREGRRPPGGRRWRETPTRPEHQGNSCITSNKDKLAIGNRPRPAWWTRSADPRLLKSSSPPQMSPVINAHGPNTDPLTFNACKSKVLLILTSLEWKEAAITRITWEALYRVGKSRMRSPWLGGWADEARQVQGWEAVEELAGSSGEEGGGRQLAV